MKKLCLLSIAGALLAAALLPSCARAEEMTLEELEGLAPAGIEELLARTQNRPWRGGDFAPGRHGGTWNSSFRGDPQTFNHILAERDAHSSAIVRMMTDSFADFDTAAREWVPRLTFFEVVADEAAGTLDVILTLRENLYWTYYGSDVRVPVTSDDVIFWYDEIEGDPRFNSSLFPARFVTMEDGSYGIVTIHRIDDRSFRFHFPRIVADPILTINRDFGPRHVFEPALRERGVDGVLDLFSVASDPRLIPSIGSWHFVEYSPAHRMVFRRNPNFWETNTDGASIPYREEVIVRILPDQHTEFLVFMQGGLESYLARPEDLDELINRDDPFYTVFVHDGTLTAPLWSFNQNPINSGEPWQEWFSRTEFRQAMSSMLDRDRLARQVYRGLAEPKLWFFPPPNPFYNPDIRLQFTYDRRRALELLESIGMSRDAQGVMRDERGNRVEFDLSFPADVFIWSDKATVMADMLAGIGIRVNLRPTDFQRLVQQLTVTFDWQSVLISLGPSLFPTQGVNVWLSSGNLHMWHPLQESPHTEWEARIDWLFNEGMFTYDAERAWPIWNEFQEIILYQLPVIYLMRQRSFWAINDRWDLSNVFFDNMNSAMTSRVFLSAGN